MKKIALLLLLMGNLCFSQILKPVTWETSATKISETEYELILTAHIEKGWHLYALDLPENGPLPTVITFDKDPDYNLLGKMLQEKGITKYEPTFEMDVTYFEKKTTFKQRIKTSNPDLSITGTIDYMCCNQEQCIVLFKEFDIKL